MAPQFSRRTLAVRGPGPHEPADRPVAPPLVQSSTFEFASTGALRRFNETGRGHMYSRYGNPTIESAENVVAALEGAEGALLFASGMAATSAIYLALVKSGDAVAAMRSIYGGTFKLLGKHLPALGVRTTFLEPAELDEFESRIEPGTRVLHLETPTNPTLRIVDIQDLSRRAHALGITVVADNTFATPILQNPLELGADIVYHSATKYLSGHSDMTGGVIASSRERLAPIETARRIYGGCADPFAAWLLVRGLKTLALRVEAQARGAAMVASRLSESASVRRVLYPGLPGHPEHALASRQMRGYGAMVTIELEGGLAAAERAMDRFGLVLRAASLGSVESLASIPVHTSHAGFTAEELARAGVEPGMIRLSIGIEDPEDLVADLERALG